MHSIRKFIRVVFGFSRRETNGFLILIPLMLVIIFSYPLFHSFSKHYQRDYLEEERQLDSLVAIVEMSKVEKEVNYSIAEPTLTTTLFHFDPNTVRKEALVRLGFSYLLANRLLKFREHGGSFRNKEDLLVIHGLDSALYYKLVPYITLPERGQIEKNNTKPPVSIEIADINIADTTQLKQIRGIGSTLSARILKYRKLLGGFVSLDQVHEVYGMDSAVVRAMKNSFVVKSDFVPQRLAINHLNEEELSHHPYVSRKLAKAMVAYRFQHGLYKSFSDCTKMQLPDAERLSKLEPYLSFE